MNLVTRHLSPTSAPTVSTSVTRMIFLGAVVASVVTVSLSGCSPPPPSVEQVDLSVGTPDADPGKLTGDPISPPPLQEIDGVASRAVAMRLSEEAAGQPQGASQRGTSGTEEVPTPSPDSKKSSAEVVPTPAGKSEADAAANKTARRPDAEPEREGDPEGDTETLDPEVFPEGAEPEDYSSWETPQVALVVTGQQHGYIEPCGCTGLDRQKGGMARRFTFMKQLRDKGWSLVPIDAGNQVRRFGRQAEIKLQTTAKALKQMDYQLVGFGPDDLRLGVGELLAVAAAEDFDNALYVSANVELIDPSLMPQTKIVTRNGVRIGISSVLDPEAMEVATSDEIVVRPPLEAASQALDKMRSEGADYRVLTYFGDEDRAKELVKQVDGVHLLVVAGGYGEPTYRPELVEGTGTRMIATGSKGMYAGLVGLYSETEIKYARVPLTHEFKDAPEMRVLMKEYQDQLRDVGLKGLGLLPPIPHASGHKFVGTAKCGECHTIAHDIWQGTPHAQATQDIIQPPKERGDIARHFDPECLSCHVTGWNPQEYYPYASGYLSLEEHSHLTGNGCENCHGPGSEHVAAEVEGSTISDEVKLQLREAMRLPLEKARERCMECHDLDNSPDFHEEDAFEDIYWPEVEHYGTE